MPKLIQERISRTEEIPMPAGDQAKVLDRMRREIKIYLPAYLGIMAAAVYVRVVKPMPGSWRYPRLASSEEQRLRVEHLVPYVFGFAILAATIYFLVVFFQVIWPLIRDFREKRTTLVYFFPKKATMSFFNRYFISTPLYDNQEIEVSPEDFNRISDNQELCLELAKNSRIILRISSDGREIRY